MLTPVFSSEKFVGELIFAIGPTGRKSNFSLLENGRLKILKKSHKVGEKKYPSLCTGVGQRNSTLGPE